MAPPDLSRRVAVVAVGVPAVVVALYVGGWVLAVPLALLGAQGAAETYDLAEAGGVRPFRWPGMFVAGSFSLLAAGNPTFTGMAPWCLGAALALASLSLVLALALRWPEGKPLPAVASTLFGAAYGGLALSFVPLLVALPARLAWEGPQHSPWAGVLVTALPLATTWIGDGTAYFVGTAWGRKKLAPRVSPAKSWVGAYAGLVGSALAAAVWYLVAKPLLPGLPVRGILVVAGLGALLGGVAQVGDLVESLLKREAGVKNSGRAFPGHGGVLDRIDSLIFALPTAYALLAILGMRG